MDLNNILKAFQSNYRLDPHSIGAARELILNSTIKDYSELMQYIVESTKFDFLAKLDDALKRLGNNLVKLSDEDNTKVYNYADSLFSKVTAVFNEIEFLLQTKYTIDHDNITLFLSENFNEKDLKVLSLIGKRERIYHLNRTDKTQLRQEIEKAIKALTANKKRLEIGYKPKYDTIDSKVIKLIGSKG